MPQIKIVDNNDAKNFKNISYDFSKDTIEDVIVRYNPTLNESNCNLSFGDEDIIRDWCMAMKVALNYGNTIKLYCYNIRFYLKRDSGNDTNRHSITMDCRESIESLKKRVRQFYGLKTYYQRLVHNEKVLKADGGGSLWSNKIDNDSLIHVKEECVSISIKVFIAALTRPQLEQIEVYPSETIAEFKTKIAHKFNISIPYQQLELNSTILDDNKCVSDYRLKNKSSLDLYFNDVDMVKFEIKFISIVSGEEFSLLCNGSAKVADLRRKLDGGYLHYRFNSELKCLDDDRYISEYGLMDNEKPIRYNPPGYACIVVKCKGRKDLVLDIKLTSRVVNLKNKISEFEDLDVENQRLVFAGTPLDDKKVFADYAITNGAVIEFLRQPDFEFAGLEGVPKVLSWDKRAPVWRVVDHGLCIEGKCTNEECFANGKMVIINMGLPVFHQTRIRSETTICPSCENHVNPLAYAFNNCEWRYIGVMKGEGGEKKIKSLWKKAGDTYHRFPEANQSEWINLLIETKNKDKSLTETPFCGTCLQTKSSNIRDCEYCKTCKKRHHRICLEKWRKSSKGCPCCNKV